MAKKLNGGQYVLLSDAEHERIKQDRYEHEMRPRPWTPLQIEPTPFPGNDQEVLYCKDCSDPFTMAEFRVFCWVETSDYCVTCGSRRMHQMIERITSGR